MKVGTCALIAGACIAAAAVIGTYRDTARPAAGRTIDRYHVLAMDFHVHSFPFSWSTMSVFDTIVDARHQGLDAVVLTPHNHVWVARVGAWFSRAIGGPMVVEGEEITAPVYHMLAVGTHDTIPSTLSAAETIAAIHRQGGVAIAAHPYPGAWPAYDEAALRTLDASEIVRPDSRRSEKAAAELREFFGRGQFAAIGASDYHGLGPVGYGRTYVFVEETSPQGVVDAIRARRTITYDGARAYGDPQLIALAAANNAQPPDGPAFPAPDALAVFSRIAPLIAFAALLLFNRSR
jgi:hypothetical protein